MVFEALMITKVLLLKITVNLVFYQGYMFYNWPIQIFEGENVKNRQDQYHCSILYYSSRFPYGEQPTIYYT